MLDFNSSSLRFKFIYLTKNIYDGIAIHAIFQDVLAHSDLPDISQGSIPFHLIDKYINFIPFSLRFNVTNRNRKRTFENDIVLSAKREKEKRITFSNILFFVDMYNPEHTSFLSIAGLNDITQVRERIGYYLSLCANVLDNPRRHHNSNFLFTLREQQIVFYLLQGMSVKQIANELDVSDKLVYRNLNGLAHKVISQKDPQQYIKNTAPEYASWRDCYA